MKINGFLLCFLSLLALSGCRSARNTTSNNHTVATPPANKTNTAGKREFLNGIEVTPGGSAANANPKNSSVTKNGGTKTTYTKSASNASSFNIEKANMLQLKYAVLTDALVESLTNIPLLAVIDKWWGTKYCMGGNTENCLDCSAFTQIVMRDVYKLMLPRTAQEQFNTSLKVEPEDIREGDLVFFSTGGKDISHVGIYLINNKFVHAATSGGVMISDLNDKYWQPRYKGAGRVVSSK